MLTQTILHYLLRNQWLQSGQDLSQHLLPCLHGAGLLQLKIFGDGDLQVCLQRNMGRRRIRNLETQALWPSAGLLAMSVLLMPFSSHLEAWDGKFVDPGL